MAAHRAPVRRSRVVLVAGALVGCLLLGGGAVVASGAGGPGGTTSPGGTTDAADPPGRPTRRSEDAVRPAGTDASATEPAAVRVLRAWDRRRAAAWAAGSPSDLRALYAAGSAAGRADVRRLRSYLRRGLRVEGMRMQLLAVGVLDHPPGEWRLRVTDRLVGAVAVAPDGTRRALPRDAAGTTVVRLARGSAPRGRDGGSGSEWRVVAVRPVSDRARR